MKLPTRAWIQSHRCLYSGVEQFVWIFAEMQRVSAENLCIISVHAAWTVDTCSMDGVSMLLGLTVPEKWKNFGTVVNKY